ncbi:hypothetical protein QBC34DRAFT_374159 [Podospora aff. communis PSN243]|uniref:Uncharacterized protein n=1 Tax=Podospora aff. communis PSN243 TaxID=3040156 RepID=A0AAV9H3K1_9PEZI|nr:hypothetical protein QBC34DRAFT_374159 [Podospora aff. communis PSN243]
MASKKLESLQGASRGQQRHWIITWFSELLSTTFSISLIATIIAILQQHNGKPQPEFFLSLTLNGLLQLLITAAQFSFSYPLARGLAQLKWLWFLPHAQEHRRSLYSFEVYDEACRSNLWGSVKLLFRLRGGDWDRTSVITYAAALVLASAVLSGPSTQQVLTFDTRTLSPLPNGTATLNRVTYLSLMNGAPDVDQADNESNVLLLQAALFEGGQAAVANPASNQSWSEHKTVITPLEPHCSTLDCTWEPYSTLAICAKVIDVTDLNRTATAMYRNKVLQDIEKHWTGNLNRTATALEAMYEAGGSRHIAMPDYQRVNYVAVSDTDEPLVPVSLQSESLRRASFVEFVVAHTDDAVDMISKARWTEKEKFRLLAMQFFFCVKAFETRVTAGVVETRLLGETIDVVTSQSTAHTLNVGWWEYNTADKRPSPADVKKDDSREASGSHIALAAPPGLHQNRSYKVHMYTAKVLGGDLRGSINGLTVFQDRVTAYYLSNRSLLSTILPITLHGTQQSKTNTTVEERRDNLSALAQSIADSLTNMLRSPLSPYNNKANNQPAIATGTAFSPIPLIRVRWPWLALLVSQVAATVLILAIIINMTARRSHGMHQGQVVPKDNSIATLCALDTDLRERLGLLGDVERLNQGSKGMDVRLEWRRRGGGGLVLVEDAGGDDDNRDDRGLGSLLSTAQACLEWSIIDDYVNSRVVFNFKDNGVVTCSGSWYSWQGGEGGTYWAPTCKSGYRAEVSICSPGQPCPKPTWLVTYGAPHDVFTWNTGWSSVTYNGKNAYKASGKRYGC